MSKELKWEIEDHICRKCGGRILRCVSPVITGGGNPLFRCADCGASAAGFTPEVLCWCGFKQKGQTKSAYVCVHRKEGEASENLRMALAKCGFDIKRGVEVGIGLCEDVEKARAGE